MTFKLYDTLGLNRNDDPNQKEIKKAYHKKALQHHPDKNPNDKNNEILFKEISNAYTILSDENKKKTYDNLGDENYQEGNQNDMNPEDIFQHFFGNNNNPFGSSFTSSFNFDFRKQNRKCSNITKIINVTLEDVYNGVDSTMKINVKNYCLNCITICNECDGKGIIQTLRNLGLMQQIIQQTCEKCRGKGEIIELNKSCKKCCGEGTYINEHSASLRISAGFPNNYKTSFKGLGEQPKSKNEISGDLIIQINVSENKYFKRDNNDLYYTYNINYLDSILGKNIEIPYFNENIKLNTKNYGIILHKNEYTIKNKGLPIFNKENNYGNLIIKFEINSVKLKENINENDINSFKEHFNKLIIN